MDATKPREKLVSNIIRLSHIITIGFYSSYSLGMAEYVDAHQLDPFGHAIG